METLQAHIKTIITQLGLNEASVDFDSENRKISVFANEGEWLKRWTPKLIGDLEHVIRLLAKRYEHEGFFVDINNYRKERERLIVELAKAAAKKVSNMKSEVRLPAMNAYERRLVHLELSIHPEVKTESTGEGHDRCVVVKPISL